MTTTNYRYSIVEGQRLDDGSRLELKDLFDRHYGTWAASAPQSGQRVAMPRRRLDDLLNRRETYVLIARAGDTLVGYAIGARIDAGGGTVSWVTQLVVHSEHQRNGIATRLLKSAWGFSDDQAWGLASANPFAIRALEAATLRRCAPREIRRHLDMLRTALPRVAGYLDAPIAADENRAVIDTDFPVSHEALETSISKVSDAAPWLLGQLDVTEEWLAVVFQSQEPRDLTAADIDELFDAGGSVVAEAYDRMAQGAVEPHVWMKHFASESEALVQLLQIAPGARVLDLGCGNGRHAVELAARGYQVTAVDRSEAWLAQARLCADERGQSTRFVQGDARSLDLGQTFDAVISLYDVIGSFRRDHDNQAIVSTIRRHLNPGGTFAISVMNRVVTERIAIHTGDVAEEPNLVHRIPATSTMQDTGDIWDPEQFLADTSSGVVYRRERFGMAGMLPIELLVCDRRYRPDELEQMCRVAGMRVTSLCPVGLGEWSRSLAVDDWRAKELLCAGVALPVGGRS